MNGDGGGDGAGAGTGVEVDEGAKDGSGDGPGTETGTGVGSCRRTQDGKGDANGDGSENNSGHGNGDEDNGHGNKDMIGDGGREAKKRIKTKNSFRRHMGNRGDLGGKRKKCTEERVGPVAANPDNIESNKEAGEGGQGTQGLRINCTGRESVSPLLRLIRGFRNNYH